MAYARGDRVHSHQQTPPRCRPAGESVREINNCRCMSLRHLSDTYGRLFAYDKAYDRITTKTPQTLQLVDRIKYNTTASDDPVLQQVNYLLLLSTRATH
jgi:hypothetical protein